MTRTPSPNDPWQFFTVDGKLIGTFPPGFHVNAHVFLLLMSAHRYAWQEKYLRN